MDRMAEYQLQDLKEGDILYLNDSRIDRICGNLYKITAIERKKDSTVKEVSIQNITNKILKERRNAEYIRNNFITAADAKPLLSKYQENLKRFNKILKDIVS